MLLDVQTIASRDNPRFKALQKRVAQPRLLRKEGQAIAEGLHLLQELSNWPDIQICEVWFAEGLRRHREWSDCQALMAALDIVCTEVPDALYERLSELQQGLGPLIVFNTPLLDDTQTHVEDAHGQPADASSEGLPAGLDHDILLLDGVQDPGNVGTLIRTAAAVGIREIWTTPDCAWVWSGKVLRAAMGGHRHVRLPAPQSDCVARVSYFSARGIPVRLMHLAQSQSLFEADLRTPGFWLLGSEGQGVSDALAGLANQHLRIPMQSGVESLNVSAAAAVCLYEQFRQRAGASRA